MRNKIKRKVKSLSTLCIDSATFERGSSREMLRQPWFASLLPCEVESIRVSEEIILDESGKKEVSIYIRLFFYEGGSKVISKVFQPTSVFFRKNLKRIVRKMLCENCI